MQKGQGAEIIAEDLVESLSVVQPICEFIMNHLGCDGEPIYENLIRK